MRDPRKESRSMSPSSSAHPDIELSADVGAFFRDVLQEAKKRQRFEATDAAETYLVALLADFARPDQLTGAAFDRPVTLLLVEALESVGKERFDRLRTLGDGVLFVTGFFGDHLQTRGVELDYVSSVGARAYEGAASMLRRAAAGAATPRGASDLFGELAGNFAMFVDLLSAMADAVLARSAQGERGLLKLYERWLKTGSPLLGDALAVRGVCATRGDGVLH
jgi:hypothetical protein